MDIETLTVPEEAVGWRLDQLLVLYREGLSRSFAQKLIRNALVTVDGKPSKPSYRLRSGETVQIQVPPPVALDLQPESIPLDILHEDGSLIVVNKPAGMVVHPGAGQSHGTLVNALLAHCDSLAGIGGVERPGIVHRLDKDTSGVLVVAKTDEAHHDLSAQFRRHHIERRYVALVCGTPARNNWKVDTFIGRSPRDRKKMAVVNLGGRRAITHFHVVEPLSPFAMLHAHLETGRTHQIRVHLSHSGYPVIGDPTYGGGRQRAIRMAPKPTTKHAIAELGRQALHAGRLGFLHPVTRESLAFESPLPDDIQAVLDTLRPADDSP